jgi:hypothetical protein
MHIIVSIPRCCKGLGSEEDFVAEKGIPVRIFSPPLVELPSSASSHTEKPGKLKMHHTNSRALPLSQLEVRDKKMLETYSGVDIYPQESS